MASPLQRAAEVMDVLRSPGGCPWDAAQTHQSLARYLLEETYEVLEAIETGDVALLREELGDLLLQVLFHARLAQELPPGQAFSVEDVAEDLVAKLIRRHPHVFAADPGGPSGAGSATAHSADSLNESWERQKISEKGRTSAVDGVPLGQPALALSAKLVSRATRAGLAVTPERTTETGEGLFAAVRAAVAAGIDPETALRETARAYRNAIVAAEAGLNPAAAPPLALGPTSDRHHHGAVTDRTEAPLVADERATLIGFLDYQRATLASKCAGLSPEQLASRAVPPSTLSLLGLLRHAAEVERGWFRDVARTETRGLYWTEQQPDFEFDGAVADPALVERAYADWRAEIAYADDMIAAHGMDDSFARAKDGEAFSLRWIMSHLIEEYARHNGHADLLRQVIDGATGE